MAYLDYSDIQQMFKMNARQAKAFLRSDGVPSIKIGNRYYIEPDKLNEYLKTTKTTILNY